MSEFKHASSLGDFNNYNKYGNNMDLKDEDNSWTHFFSGYRDEGYWMTMKTARVLSSVHAICSPMTSVMETTSTAMTRALEKFCQGECHGRWAATENGSLYLVATLKSFIHCYTILVSCLCIQQSLIWCVMAPCVCYHMCVCLLQHVNSVPSIIPVVCWGSHVSPLPSTNLGRLEVLLHLVGEIVREPNITHCV